MIDRIHDFLANYYAAALQEAKARGCEYWRVYDGDRSVRVVFKDADKKVRLTRSVALSHFYRLRETYPVAPWPDIWPKGAVESFIRNNSVGLSEG